MDFNQSAAKGGKPGKASAKKAQKPKPPPEPVTVSPTESESLFEEEEVYDLKAIDDFMNQEALPEDDCLIFNFTAQQQTTIFGVRTVTRLNAKLAGAPNTPSLQPVSSMERTDSIQASEASSALSSENFAPRGNYVGLNMEREQFLLSLTSSNSTDALVAALKEKVAEYPADFITFIVDQSMRFEGNFIMILSQELDNTLRLEPLDIKEDTVKVDVIEEADDYITWVYPNLNRPWKNLGSDLEIKQATYFESRPRVVMNFERPRRYFGAKRELTSVNSAEKYTDIKPYEDKSFEVPILELERGISCTNSSCDRFTNTEWRYPRNQVVQYIPRFIDDKENVSTVSCKTKSIESRPQFTNVSHLLPLFEQGLKENLMFDFLFDDFDHLADGDETYDNKSANNFKEVISFSDLKFSKDKAVSHIEWHPTIDGLLAMSAVERLGYDDRVNQYSRVLMTASYIIIWSFFEPIQPQLLLLAPEDIFCFEFNPTNPNIVVGGCHNGMVVLWDISKHEYDLANVLERVKNKQKVPLFQFDENENLKVPVMPWCATSNIEASHATPIKFLQWMPDHIELNRGGLAFENVQRSSCQVLTCAADSGIFVWDIRPDKSPLAVDKTRDQMIMPRDVPPTFNALDTKWKPILRVNLFRSENAPEHCPTCFCIQEKQGNRAVLDLKVNQRKKLAAEKDKNRVGLPKAQPLDGINPFVFAGTEDGDIVYVDWMPQKDVKTAKMQTSMPAFVAPQHDGPISYIARSPFMSEVILCVGGFSWSLWKEGVTSGALLCSAPYSKAVTGGLWSPSRPSVFYIILSDGVLESWDLLDKTHEPALVQSVSASALTSISIKMESRKHFVAIGDMHGALKVLVIPYRLKVCGMNELDGIKNYIEREVHRRSYVIARWLKREKERVQQENDKKRLAGISTAAQLSEDEKLKKLRSEYEEYLFEERAFLRALGLYEEPEDDLAMHELTEKV